MTSNPTITVKYVMDLVTTECKKLHIEVNDIERIDRIIANVVDGLFRNILNKKLRVAITYGDPDQTPIQRESLECRVLISFRRYKVDYWPERPNIMKNYFSQWLLAIYHGNYDKFQRMIAKMTPADVEKHLAMRESAMQIGAIFHVIIGALTLSAYSPGDMPNHMKIMEQLINLGADVHAKDVAGYTPLHYAVEIHGSDSLKIAIMKLLLDHGADVHAGTRIGTSLLLIGLTNRVGGDVIKFLVKHGADPYKIEEEFQGGSISSMDSAGYYYPSMIKHLLLASRKEIITEQLDAIQAGVYKTCACKRHGKKRCSGCLIEWHCSEECQKTIWTSHQPICKERRGQYLPVQLLIPGLLKDSKFTVSLQICFTDRIVVYDEAFSIRGELVPSSTADAFLKIVRDQGFKGFKGHFNAMYKKGQLLIHPQILPPQIW